MNKVHFSVNYLETFKTEEIDNNLLSIMQQKGSDAFLREYQNFNSSDNLINIKALELFRKLVFTVKNSNSRTSSFIKKADELFHSRLKSFSTSQSMIDAAICGYLELVEAFHDGGLSPHIISENTKLTLLNYSISRDHIRLSEWLINQKVPFTISENGRTALHSACLRGQSTLIPLLLNTNYDPNLPDLISGNTPLHLACSKSETKPDRLKAARLALYLFSRGANPSLMNKENKKPVDFILSEHIYNAFKMFGKAKSTTLNTLGKDARRLIYKYLHQGELLSTARKVCKQWNNLIIYELAEEFMLK
jgi:hypothetical protein